HRRPTVPRVEKAMRNGHGFDRRLLRGLVQMTVIVGCDWCRRVLGRSEPYDSHEEADAAAVASGWILGPVQTTIVMSSGGQPETVKAPSHYCPGCSTNPEVQALLARQRGEAERHQRFAVIENGRHEELEAVRAAVGGATKAWNREGRQLAELFPIVGANRGLYDRLCAAHSRWYLIALRFFLWLALRLMQRRYRGRPGWNDYYMAWWLVSGSEGPARELFSRAANS